MAGGATDETETWRAPTSSERALLTHLVRGDFLGRREILQQIISVEVMRISPQGSLKLRTSGPPADVKDNDAPSSRANDFMPVEGFYDDSASDRSRLISMARPVRLALHVTAGRISKLEIWKEDGSAIVHDPYEIDLAKIHFY